MPYPDFEEFLAALNGRRVRYVVGGAHALVVEGFPFFFFSNEGSEPQHIHVERGDGLPKFWLQPVELVEVYQMKQQEVRQARILVEQHQALFLEKWHEYFGT